MSWSKGGNRVAHTSATKLQHVLAEDLAGAQGSGEIRVHAIGPLYGWCRDLMRSLIRAVRPCRQKKRISVLEKPSPSKSRYHCFSAEPAKMMLSPFWRLCLISSIPAGYRPVCFNHNWYRRETLTLCCESTCWCQRQECYTVAVENYRHLWTRRDGGRGGA
jgi:hypothetical protein